MVSQQQDRQKVEDVLGQVAANLLGELWEYMGRVLVESIVHPNHLLQKQRSVGEERMFHDPGLFGGNAPSTPVAPSIGV